MLRSTLNGTLRIEWKYNGTDDKSIYEPRAPTNINEDRNTEGVVLCTCAEHIMNIIIIIIVGAIRRIALHCKYKWIDKSRTD